jgi:rhamnosyltransferase
MGDVSIILPTRNNENHIKDLLTSIFSQRFEGNLKVLMLDSSNDRTPQIASAYSKKGDLRIIRVDPENYNYGGTRNFGASLTSCEYLVFISTDVDIRNDDWLKKLVMSLKDPSVAGVYGRQIPREDASPMEEFFIKYTYPNERKVYYLGEVDKLKDFFFSNTNSAIRYDVWEKIPLPEMLKSEDQEWAKRVLLAGYKIMYEPDAYVYHSHHYTLKKVFKEYFDSGATMPYIYNDKRINSPNFFSKGLDYEVTQLRYFLEKNYFKDIPYSFVYDFMKFLGYSLGTKCMYMPIGLRKTLCKKSNHWDKYNSAIDLKKEVENRISGQI